MPHVFLSPHLDDAPLSCGGVMHALAQAGARVLVVTACAGPPPEGSLSGYALSLHARWGQPPERARAAAAEMVARRRDEDRAALTVLGAEAKHLDLPDVIYRRGASGRWLVESDAALFAGFREDDEPWVERLAASLEPLGSELSQASEGTGGLYVPLGIGDHADHHLVRRAAERLVARQPGLAQLCRYYEDYPYAGEPERLTAATRALEARGWIGLEFPLSEADLGARIEAVACYRSQISTFWPDRASMASELRAFAAARGRSGAPSERYWQPDPAARG